MITDNTKKKVALLLRDVFGASTSRTKLGTGGGGTNPTSTTLDVPLPTSTDGTTSSSSSDDKVIEFRATFTGGELQGYTIREIGFFGDIYTDDNVDEMIDNTRTSSTSEGTDSAYTTENIMLSRINFDAIGNFSTSDTIEVIYTMEVE